MPQTNPLDGDWHLRIVCKIVVHGVISRCGLEGASAGPFPCNLTARPVGPTIQILLHPRINPKFSIQENVNICRSALILAFCFQGRGSHPRTSCGVLSADPTVGSGLPFGKFANPLLIREPIFSVRVCVWLRSVSFCDNYISVYEFHYVKNETSSSCPMRAVDLYSFLIREHNIYFRSARNRVRTPPEKSWIFFLENSRTWKVLEKSLWSWTVLEINAKGPGKSWKNILESHALKISSGSCAMQPSKNDELTVLVQSWTASSWNWIPCKLFL